MEKIEQKFDGAHGKINLPEVPDSGWKTLILLQRHGRYDARRPADPENLTKEEKEKLGRLTPEGIEEVKQRTRERLRAILLKDPSRVDFLILNSPTFWLDDERLGQRARETAEVIAEEIKKELEERNLPESQIINLTNIEGKPAFKGGVSRPEKRLGEALMFQVPEFTDFLRQECGRQGPKFWKNFFRDTYKKKREELGAEGPLKIADRMNEFLSVIARFARMYHRRHPEKRLVPWVVAHGDSVMPYVQRVVGVPEKDFNAGYNEGIGIAFNPDGQATVQVKGKKYEIPFVAYGKPSSFQPDK